MEKGEEEEELGGRGKCFQRCLAAVGSLLFCSMRRSVCVCVEAASV